MASRSREGGACEWPVGVERGACTLQDSTDLQAVITSSQALLERGAAQCGRGNECCEWR